MSWRVEMSASILSPVSCKLRSVICFFCWRKIYCSRFFYWRVYFCCMLFSWDVIYHPTNSPNLALWNLYLFTSLKSFFLILHPLCITVSELTISISFISYIICNLPKFPFFLLFPLCYPYKFSLIFLWYFPLVMLPSICPNHYSRLTFSLHSI